MQLQDAPVEQAGARAAVPNAGTDGEAEAARRGDVEATHEQKKAERKEAKQRCNTAAFAIAAAMTTNGTEDKDKLEETAKKDPSGPLRPGV